MDQYALPRLAQCNVCNAMLVAKCDLNVSKGVEVAAIDAYIFMQGFENEGSLIEGGFRFSRHECALSESSKGRFGEVLHPDQMSRRSFSFITVQSKVLRTIPYAAKCPVGLG